MGEQAVENVTAKKPPSKWLLAGITIIGTAFLGAVGTGIYSWLTTSLTAGPPLAATLSSVDTECEGLLLDSSVSLPERDAFTPEWAYEQNGATSSKFPLELTVQGTSSRAVVLHGFEVLEIEREPLPPEPRIVSKCGPIGGDLAIRYLSVDFTAERPAVIARSDGEEEPIDFPYTVSQSDPEYFFITFDDTSVQCVCSWRLGVRWSSGGDSGTLIVDRGFGKIRTAFDTEAPYLWWKEGGEPEPL